MRRNVLAFVISSPDMLAQIMLASWRGTRFEVVQVLREVCDRVLKEKGQSDSVLLNRAKASLQEAHLPNRLTSVPSGLDPHCRNLQDDNGALTRHWSL